MDSNHYNIIIAGAGSTGILFANALYRQRPDLKIAILEKEPRAGGRLKSLEEEDLNSEDLAGHFGYGLNSISKSTCDFWMSLFKDDPNITNPPKIGEPAFENLAIIMAGKASLTPVQSLMSISGFRALGGAAAGREWNQLEEFMEKWPEKSLGQCWKAGQKSPGAIVLRHYARLFGISDLFSSSLQAIKERSYSFCQDRYKDNWRYYIQKTIASIQSESIDLCLDSQIYRAEYNDSRWTVTNKNNKISSDTLIVCQSPWEALQWLPKPFFPKNLLSLVTKTTPSSVVALSILLERSPDTDVCDLALVPAEDVQIIKSSAYEYCFQATIDYESSLQSETVGKAVRRLKRSLKKFLEVYPSVKVKQEHLALVPVAWAPSTNAEHLSLQKNIENDDLCQKHLIFCGDSYGTSYDGDTNFITSINKALNFLSESL